VLTTPQRKIGLAAWYNAVNAVRGFALAPHHYPLIAGLEDHRIENLLSLGPPGTGKSGIVSSVYPAWELGHDPTLTIMAVSAGEKLPQGFMSAAAQIIQHDKTWAETFPEVRPAPELGWSKTGGLFVSGHHASDPDASFISIGLASKALTGLHARLHIYDDIHDRENSSTLDGRAQVVRTYYDTLLGRADPRGCRRVAVGRWWAEDDVYQEWIASGDWVVLQLPAARPGQTRLWYDVYVPRGLECVYTETLPKNTIQDETSRYVRYRAFYGAVDPTREGFYWPGSPSKRSEYAAVQRRQPRIAAVNYNGDMRGAGDPVFIETDFVPFFPPEHLDQGITEAGVHAWCKAMHGDVEQAWDTALGQPQSGSMTVALTGLLVPCKEWHCGEDVDIVGTCDFHFDVYLLDLMAKNLDFRKLVLAFRAEYAKWMPLKVTVEEKSSGTSLLQLFRGSQIPVRGQKIEQGKVARAVNPVFQTGLPIGGGAASVQGWGRMGRIRYPIGQKWVTHGADGDKDSGFLGKVLSYKGGSSESGSDEFDALVHLVTRAILRSHRHGRIGVEKAVDAEQLEVAKRLSVDPRYQMIQALGAATAVQRDSGIVNPTMGMCGSCHKHGIFENKEWCHLHQRTTMAFNGCTYWMSREAAERETL
jgi:hypothetical protein